MKSRRVTLIVAVVLALAMGVLTLRYLSSVNTKSQVQVVEMRPVVIANVAIAPRAKLKPQMLTRVMRAANTLEPGSIDDAKEVEGDIALVAIPAGAGLTETKVGVPATIGVTGRLRPGQRAVSIPVDLVKSVSGLIAPGDRVDVMASLPASALRSPHTATIIRGALVLAVNANIDPNATAALGATPAPAPAGPPPAATTITLAVSAQQADLLTVADVNATLRLALRSPDEEVGSLPSERLDLPNPPAPVTYAPPLPGAASPGAAAGTAAKAPSRAVDGVTLIDGDKSVIVPR